MSEAENLKLWVDSESIEAFVICLALGTLKAMDDGVLQEEAGTWTLGRPGFRKPLEGLISEDVLAVLGQSDELSAIRELCSSSDESKKVIQEAISTLETRLRLLKEPMWYALWLDH